MWIALILYQMYLRTSQVACCKGNNINNINCNIESSVSTISVSSDIDNNSENKGTYNISI